MPIHVRIAAAGAIALSLVVASASAIPASANEPPPPIFPAQPWTLDFTGSIRPTTDYNFRGISQSDRRPVGQAFWEFRYGPLYVGGALYGIDLPWSSKAEVDWTFGIRPTIGPVSFDFGAIAYTYPGSRALVAPDPAGTVIRWTPGNGDYVELYARASVTPMTGLLLGVNVFHTENWLRFGNAATYVSGNFRLDLPHDLALSGELGHQALGRVKPLFGGIDLPDYALWNLGVTWTARPGVSVDLRYFDTNLTERDCFAITADQTAVARGSDRSRWCGAALIATLGFEVSFTDILGAARRSSPFDGRCALADRWRCLVHPARANRRIVPRPIDVPGNNTEPPYGFGECRGDGCSCRARDIRRAGALPTVVRRARSRRRTAFPSARTPHRLSRGRSSGPGVPYSASLMA